MVGVGAALEGMMVAAALVGVGGSLEGMAVVGSLEVAGSMEVAVVAGVGPVAAEEVRVPTGDPPRYSW